MRGPLTVVLASILSFLLLGSAFSGEAHAQKKNVVVEMMKGPMAPRLRIVVTKSLARGGFDRGARQEAGRDRGRPRPDQGL